MQRALVSIPGDAPLADFTRALRGALDGSGPAIAPLPPTAHGPAVPSASALPLPGGVPDGVALVLSTSGSTGEPRRVLLDAAAVLASARATHERLGGPGRWVLALPRHHVAGMQVVARSLVTGLAPVVVPPGRFDPVAMADAVRDARRAAGTRHRLYAALVPTQLHRIVGAWAADTEAALRPLADLDAIIVGGAATAPGLLERARDVGLRVVTTYGMTETAGGCVYDGVPLDGVAVRIDGPSGPVGPGVPDGSRGPGGPDASGGPDGAPAAAGLGHGAFGVVQLAGPMLARGYVPDDTASFIEADGVRWFRTCDVGELVDGVLRVHGRADDVIVSGGVNVAPAAVEAVLSTLGVGEVCVVGLPDREWGMVVTAVVAPGDSVAPDLDVLHDAVAERLGSWAAPRVIVVVDRLQYRGPGKVDRAAVAREAAALVEGARED